MSISNFLYAQLYLFRIGTGLSIYLGTGVIHFLLLLNFSLAVVDCSIHSYICASIKMRKPILFTQKRNIWSISKCFPCILPCREWLERSAGKCFTQLQLFYLQNPFTNWLDSIIHDHFSRIQSMIYVTWLWSSFNMGVCHYLCSFYIQKWAII